IRDGHVTGVQTCALPISRMAFLAGQKGLELKCQIDPGVPAILVGDPRALSQVLINLIGNAIRFTDRGGVAVTARTELEEGMQIRSEERRVGKGCRCWGAA